MKRWNVRLLGYGMMSLALPVILYFTYLAGDAPAEPPEPLARAARPAAPRSPAISVTRHTLGAGGTLAAGFETMGVPDDLRPSLVAALANHIDLRRLSPDTGFHVATDESGFPRLFSVRAAEEKFVRARLTPGDDEPAVEVVELPLISHVESAGGRVESSLFQSLGHLASGSELALAFADIFQWDVDLLIDPRRGDLVRIVYELRTLGDVPDDLPTFGRAAMREGDTVGLGRILAASYDGSIARAHAFWVDLEDEGGGYFDGQGQPMQKTFLRSPLTYRRISSRFSRARRNPVTRKVVPHHGVDFAAPAGTPVVAAADGIVISSGWRGALGRAVRLRHGSEYVTVYGHLQGMAKGIRAGATVQQNQVIGYVGSTGRATGPHLHYTLIERGRPVDPLKFENPPAGPLPETMLPRLTETKAALSPILGSVPFLSGAEAGGVLAADERSGA